MDKPWKVICAFVGVFVAGAVFGGFFTLRSTSRRLNQELEAMRQAAQEVPAAPVVAPAPAPAVPPAPPPLPVAVAVATPAPTPAALPPRPPISVQLIRQFTQRLGLTSAQREKLRPIFARGGEDFQHLQQENERRQQQYFVDTIRLTDRMYGDVRAVLTSEQSNELDKMRREADERLDRERQRQQQLRLEAAAKAKAAKAAAAGDSERPFTAKKAKSAGP